MWRRWKFANPGVNPAGVASIMRSMKERIQKVLAAAGVDSRRHVEQMVLDGRVAVNGKTVVTLPVMVDPAKDKIAVDGVTIRTRPRRGAAPDAGIAQKLYFLLYKPRGVYSTNAVQGTQVRAVDLLPEGLPARLYPVGRLDALSKGLLLLTNDGDLTNLLTHPRYGVPKTYRATIDGVLTTEQKKEVEKGIWIPGRDGGRAIKTPPATITQVKQVGDKSVIEIVFREGKNNEVRRLFARLGHKVRDLVRVGIGPLTLDGLTPGKFRMLTAGEVRMLYKLAPGKTEPHADGRPGKPPAKVTSRDRAGKSPRDLGAARRRAVKPSERHKPIIREIPPPEDAPAPPDAFAAESEDDLSDD